MLHGLTTEFMGLFLMSPREVIVIVLVTAVVVYLAARKRSAKRGRRD
jgi:hypothetical protein